jgi:hypothetical protein
VIMHPLPDADGGENPALHGKDGPVDA